MRNCEVSRRACLKGAGAALGLPTLEAMLPGMKRAGAAGSTPKRLVFFVFDGGTPDTSRIGLSEGAHGSFWPQTVGTEFETTRILQPLADLKEDILPIANLNNVPGTPDHAGQYCSVLSGAMSKLDGDIVSEVGITVDQVAAKQLKQFTPALPLLYLSNPVHPEFNNELMSWTGARSRVYPRTQPSEAFREVFGDKTVDPATLKKRVALKQSVLHLVKADADRLKDRLGKADQQTLEKYFDSITDLEGRLASAGNVSSKCATPPSPPADTPITDESDPSRTGDQNYYSRTQVDLPSHFQKMSDLITLTLQCDMTRVVAVQIIANSLKFKWLGAPYDQYFNYHGDFEHGQSETLDNRGVRLEGYVRAVTSMVEQFGYLVRKLKETPEGDGSGSLLDNSIVVCTSEMSYGNGHSSLCLPVIVAGRGGGSVKPGRFTVAPNGGRPIADLWLSMLNAVGANLSSFGNSTGPLLLNS